MTRGSTVLARLALGHLVAEHAHVFHAHGVGEVDEAAAVLVLLLARRRLLFVHVRRGAENRKPRGRVRRAPGASRPGASPHSSGTLGRSISPAIAAQLEGRVAESVRLLEDRPPAPGRAAQGREGDGVPLLPGVAPARRIAGSGESGGQRRQERATIEGHGWLFLAREGIISAADHDWIAGPCVGQGHDAKMVAVRPAGRLGGPARVWQQRERGDDGPGDAGDGRRDHEHDQPAPDGLLRPPPTTRGTATSPPTRSIPLGRLHRQHRRGTLHPDFGRDPTYGIP